MTATGISTFNTLELINRGIVVWVEGAAKRKRTRLR